MPRTDIEGFLGGKSDASKKAIQPAVEEQAIAEVLTKTGKFAPFFETEDIFETAVAD